MRKQKICISVGNTFDTPPLEVIKIIKNAGFEYTFSPDDLYFGNFNQVVNTSKSYGVKISNIFIFFLYSVLF